MVFPKPIIAKIWANFKDFILFHSLYFKTFQIIIIAIKQYTILKLILFFIQIMITQHSNLTIHLKHYQVFHLADIILLILCCNHIFLNIRLFILL